MGFQALSRQSAKKKGCTGPRRNPSKNMEIHVFSSSEPRAKKKRFLENLMVYGEPLKPLEKYGFQHSASAARNIRSATLPAHGGESHLNPIENHWYSLCFPMPPVVKAACPWDPLLRPTQNRMVYWKPYKPLQFPYISVVHGGRCSHQEPRNRCAWHT